MHEIVDEFASDNEVWAEKFLEGWQQMTSNGYESEDLVDGPQNGWIGYYSLTKQCVEIPDFEAFIADNAPVTFTDPMVTKPYETKVKTFDYFPQVDPYICGHFGHFTTSCGLRMSSCFDKFYGGGACTGRGEGKDDLSL